MIIGHFIETDHGYTGTIQTLAIDRGIVINRLEKGSNPKAPDYRVSFVESEIGAVWNKAKEDTPAPTSPSAWTTRPGPQSSTAR